MIGLLKRAWNRRYPDWVAEVALRYLPVADLLERDPPGGRLLEVGGNNFGLTRYLAHPVVGADLSFGDRRSPLITPVRARGQALPFKNRSFEVTVCMDAMEHVPAAQRDPFIKELLRVTGRRLFIGCPMGRAAERQDRMLHEYRRALGAATVESLDEHLEHGLPQLDEVLAAIRAGASGEQRAAEIRTYPNVNLLVHRLLMSLWMRTDRISYLLHRLAVLLVHVRGRLNFGSCYRQIVMVSWK